MEQIFSFKTHLRIYQATLAWNSPTKFGFWDTETKIMGNQFRYLTVKSRILETESLI